MNELQDKTPQQLNMMVAEVIYTDCAVRIGASCESVVVYVDKEQRTVLDWINDDALAFRLMVDNLIKLNPCGDGGISLQDSGDNKSSNLIWEAEHYWWNYYNDNYGHSTAYSKNPNRAIVETFILMNQRKEG